MSPGAPSVSRPHAAPSLHAYFVKHHLPTRYPLGMLERLRVHPSRRHDRHSTATVLQAFDHCQHAPVLPLAVLHAHRTRHDRSYLAHPLACPFAPWKDLAVEDLSQHPPTRKPPQIEAIDPRLPKLCHCTRGLFALANDASTTALDRRRPPALSDPLPRRRSELLSPDIDDEAPPSDLHLIHRLAFSTVSVKEATRGTPCQLARGVVRVSWAGPVSEFGEYDQEKMVIFDIKLMVGFGCDTIPILKVPPQYPKWMEPYVQTETYDLENGGSLVFERDLYLVSEKLERPPPQFHGVRIHNTPAGEQQWMITADLKGSSEPPISERILFSFKAYSWVDGLAHALQEGLARVCGQNIAALRGSRFAHFARHDTMGEPMALSSHPVLKIHVQHLDFMLHETRKDLELTRVHSHRAQMALAHHADAIRLLAKDRRSLRLQRAKNVATITRLREKIRTLEVTVRTQQDQIQEMEEDGEDIQGGDDFLSDDNDFEDDEFTDEEDYEFLEAAEDGIIPIDVDEDNEE
ncbi:hypothetical protein QYE76_002534 [Lolium multiflorum]|uniref:Uncharacterized protein n=1 Tax=Lolium multiflorum TaxID=4521 RepID=A0AAD8VZL8_LOLMU|nr:hypothetical protein QYE76_002534 [Lolium multiflorum]